MRILIINIIIYSYAGVLATGGICSVIGIY